jgi:hypothetical protein
VEPSLMQEIGRFFEQTNEEFRRAFFPTAEPPLFRPKIPEQYEILPPSERINERSIALLLNYFMDVRNQAPATVGGGGGAAGDADEEEHEDVRPVPRKRVRRIGRL